MLKILSGHQMKKIDQKAIEELKIPGILLMENAGRAVSEQVIKITEEDAGVLIICGKGNNGGDGFVAARHLIENEIQTTVVSLYRKEFLTGSALTNHNILDNFIEITYLEDIDIETLNSMIAASTIVVDAILGTGLNSEVRGNIKQIIDSVNEYTEGEVVSVDIPSGINADNGEVMGGSVIADYTVTFHALKNGLINYPGTEYSGEVLVVPIGIPEFLTEEPEFNSYLITENYVSASLPIRPENSHKGTFGSVFNIAGSFRMTGAAYMCSLSSLIVGAGYSLLAVPQSVVPVVSSMAPEIVYVPLEETEDKTISESAASVALERSVNSNVHLIGPGISTDESTVKFISEYVQQITDRGAVTIIDADAINCLAMLDNFALPVNSILTPHPKELSRLMNVSVEEILKDRIKSAREAAERFNTIIVLKGANTVIAEPNGNVYINKTGNSGLATAGSGDVLSGMIAGFAAQGVELKDAAILGVYLHGLAADLGVKDHTEYSLTASKLMDYIPQAIKQVS